mgnify:CR=1 FL=1
MGQVCEGLRRAPAVGRQNVSDLLTLKFAVFHDEQSAGHEQLERATRNNAHDVEAVPLYAARAAEAEAQRARLTLLGLEAKVSEREQSGRTVYRVRLGPFDDKASAERVRTKLENAQIENTILRIQR